MNSPSFSPAVNGRARFAEALSAWLTSAGHEVVVVTATPGTGRSVKHPMLRIVRRPSRGERRRLAATADIVHLSGLEGTESEWLRHEVPYVVTHHDFEAVCASGSGWSSGSLCDLFTGGTACSCRSSHYLDRLQVEPRQRLAVAYDADANVCVSEFLRGYLPLPRTRVIHNPVPDGVAAHASQSRSSKRSTVAYVGRLSPEKGVENLIESAAHLQSNATVQIAGDGPCVEELKELARRQKKGANVEFLGILPTSGVRALYERAAVVCVPSLCHDALPYAVLEAMTLGRAVLGANRGGITELLQDGRGVLVEPDQIRTLAGELDRLLKHVDERARLGERAAAWARSMCSGARIGNLYVDEYEQAMARETGG